MILNEFIRSFQKNGEKKAFCIDETFYSYKKLLARINSIRKEIQAYIPESENNVAIIAHDDIDTYASIFALWFEGKTYVPLLSNAPEDRNIKVIKQACCRYVLSSKKLNQNLPARVLVSKDLADVEETQPVKKETL